MTLLLLLACAEPFSVNRKDLGPFRVAALGVREGVARAAVWSGLGPYHEASPTLEWSLDGVSLGEGYDVAVPGPGELSLVATSPEGEVKEAVVEVAEAPPTPTLRRESVVLEGLRVEARAEVVGEPIEGSAPADAAVRLHLDGVPEGSTVHWMGLDGMGTLLELDADSADLLAEEVVFDDLEVESREPTGPGIYSQLALIFDGKGANAWLWLDAAIGVEGALLPVGARLLPAEQSLGPGLVEATLVRVEGGWALEDFLAVAEVGAAPACGVEGEPFDLDWLAEGRCPLPEVEGQRLTLEIP